MKILITTPGLKFGGAERVLSVLSNQWVNAGHTVCFFLTVSKEAPAYDLDDSIQVRYCDQEKFGSGVVGIIRGIRSYAKEIKADVAISFMQDVAALTSVALLGTEVPLIYSERNDPNKTNTRKVDKIFRRIVENRAKYVVFQTEGARSFFKKSVQEKSRVILNPLDTELFPVHDFACETDEIAAVGRLEEQKNYPLLFNAFAKIAGEFPHITLSVYGDGSLRSKLEGMIEDLGMKERIILKGQVRDIRSHIKDVKAFVMTSDYEGLPNALMEAMAIGLPCVSTDCSPGGARMLIEHGVSGYIVPCNDVDAFSVGVREILTDRSKARKMAESAIKLREKTDSKQIANEWLSLFLKISKRRDKHGV